MQNVYTVVNASAGSGKTYNLVQRLLMICLRYPNNEKIIGNILALTFTNKAANEMKERILNWLGNFVQKNYAENTDLKNISKAFENEGIKINLDDLHQRSKKLLDYILHHYSVLNIGTIDKFNSRLVRSFSYELGLAQNFNLEIQAEPFLMEAVDKMLDQIGENQRISDAFMDFIHYNLENDDRVNLNNTLYRSAKEFVKDIHYEPLKRNKNFDWEKYETVKKNLREEIRHLKSDSEKIAEEVIQLLKEKNLEIEDFSGGKLNGIGKFFYEIKRFFNRERDQFPLPENEESAQENFQKGASKIGKNKENSIFEILDFLLMNRAQIIQNYILYRKKEKMLSALLPLKVNKDIQDELEKIEEENDLVLLSKFNILINENLRNEPSAFIYEKIGTKFRHYFFDEFQDTSVLQWQNFIPLRDHSVSEEDTSFTMVGDPKQSIYRFRGGDSQLMMDIINHKEKTPKKAEVLELKNNWRSAKNIVEFNNQLYAYLSDFVKDEFKNIFGESAMQNACQTEIEGRVKISLIENSKKEDFYNDASEKMRNDIQACIDNGFKFSDITILCRGNADIFNFSQKLGHLKVHYQGSEIFIKTISESGLTLELSHTLKALIAFLNWENDRKNRQFLVLMMYWLKELGRIKMQDISLEIAEILKIKNDDALLKFIDNQYHLKLNRPNFPRLNLYNFVEYYLKEISVKEKETDFLLNFLEMLYAFTQNAGATIKDFIKFWDEEGKKNTILASENIDAVQIMTIHKAKGLEFPVVFLPMLNKNKDTEFSDWFETENPEIETVNISQFNKEWALYDVEMQKFNQKNTDKNLIDRFCIQYVATTRPVEQLFLYLQKPNKSGNGLEILEFVQQKNSDSDEFEFFETKDFTKKTKAKTADFQSKSIDDISESSEKSTSIKIATPSKNYQNRNEKVKKGIFTHEILAKIHSENDIEKVLEKYLLDGMMTRIEKQEISASILKIIKENPKYFAENVEVINEKDIMISDDSGAEIYRPDRLVKTSEGWFIIDFKTGEEKEKHKKQIENYQKILENIGLKVAGTEIIYV
jgi:ATP-dependent exoDNAse (exonuclease V) beta subunit